MADHEIWIDEVAEVPEHLWRHLVEPRGVVEEMLDGLAGIAGGPNPFIYDPVAEIINYQIAKMLGRSHLTPTHMRLLLMEKQPRPLTASEALMWYQPDQEREART